MITVHHLENSRSQRVLWLLEELGAEYEVIRYARNKKTRLAPPELKAVHPLGKSPVITDGDVTVAESGAIVEYLVENHAAGNLVPQQSSQGWREYKYWLHYAEGTFMPLMVMTLIFNTIEAKSPFFIRPIAKGISGQVRKTYLGPNTKANLEFMNQHLDQNEWFCGSAFSAADIQMSFPVEAAGARSDLAEKYPNLKRFLQTIQARPAYLAALERGGPYELMS